MPTETRFSDHLKSWPLAMLPHQLLSRLVRRVTRCRVRWIKNLLIRLFMQRFPVRLDEAQISSPAEYADFNAFFTRALRPETRPLPAGTSSIACPVDGYTSQSGSIENQLLLQAKGHRYSVERLLGGNQSLAARFSGGQFATLYLSPRDYHRIHMPMSGRLIETIYIPGRLYSVAPHTVRAIPGLFTRNERLVCIFETATGPMAVILVGAIFVSCMETVWGGIANPQMGGKLLHTRYDAAEDQEITLPMGAELGRFNMGSTVILLFGPHQIQWLDTLQAGNPVSMGQVIGQLLPEKQAIGC